MLLTIPHVTHFIPQTHLSLQVCTTDRPHLFHSFPPIASPLYEQTTCLRSVSMTQSLLDTFIHFLKDSVCK